jgi:hypothetical protein
MGPYFVLPFPPPYTADRYIKAVQAAADEGFEVVVIDSLTHAWSGEGGILEYVDKVGKTKPGGNFSGWADGTPLHHKLISSIMGLPIHVIATMRSKTEWVLELNAKGKQAPRKVGMGADQRKGTDFEFDLVMSLSQENIATATKHRTGDLWRDRTEILSEKTGVELLEWLSQGVPAPAPEPPKPAPAAASAVQDQQREQAAIVTDENGRSDPGPRETPPNGTITQAQAKRLHENLFAKGRESMWFLGVIAGKGIGDGLHLTSIPSTEYERLLEIVAGFTDPVPPEPPAPAAAPAPAPVVSAEDFAEAAPEPQEAAQEVAASAAASEATEAPAAQVGPAATAEDDDGFAELDAELDKAAEAKRPPEKAQRKPTVTAPQITRLGAICASLEAKGVGEQEWRTYLETEEGVRSRTLLTKAAATRMIDRLNRWSVDLQTGVVGAKEAKVA